MENPDDPIFDKSVSTVADEESPIWIKFRYCKASIYRKMTFKNLSFEQYKILIYICIFINTFSFVIELLYLIQLCQQGHISRLDESIIPFFVTFLSFANIWLMARLTRWPTTQLALSSLCTMLCLEVAYIAQTCLHYAGSAKSAEIGLTSLFIVLQFFSAVMLYRFWEMILYNYDGPSETSSLSARNTLTSDPFGPEGSGHVRSFNLAKSSASGKNTASAQMCTALTEAAHLTDAMNTAKDTNNIV